MIFLDTDVLSYYFSGNTKIRDKIIESKNKREEICLTSITIYEILKGYKWRKNKAKELLFRNFLEKVNIFSIDDNVIELAAEIYAGLRENGQTISDADIFIAAIVMINDGILISNNTKHFSMIKNLRLLNWLEPAAAL